MEFFSFGFCLMCTVLKIFIEFITILLLFYVLDFGHEACGILALQPGIAEKAMATHSSTLAWKIPWTEEPGRLQFMGPRRLRHDWATSLSLFTFMHWRRKWQPTPVFLPGESQGQGSLVGCRPWGRTESDTTEATSQQQQQQPGVEAAPPALEGEVLTTGPPGKSIVVEFLK